MTDSVLNIVGIVLLVSSTLVLLVFRATPDRPSSMRLQAKHLNAVERLIGAATGQRLRVDWMRYKGVPKERIVALANKHGWHRVDDEISGRSWYLHFDRNPHAAVRSAQENDPYKVLTAELAVATPDVQGRYILDTSKYADLGSTSIQQAATSAGWQTIRREVDNQLVLARPGVTTAEFKHGPFLDGESPDTLRDDPAVVGRAREIERAKGFDPLSDHELNRARERNQYWSKPFNRQGRLAFFYALIGLLMLGITIGSVPDAEKWIGFTMTGIMVALFVIATTKARIIRKKRASEIGDVLDAYKELQQIYRKQH